MSSNYESVKSSKLKFKGEKKKRKRKRQGLVTDYFFLYHIDMTLIAFE